MYQKNRKTVRPLVEAAAIFANMFDEVHTPACFLSRAFENATQCDYQYFLPGPRMS